MANDKPFKGINHGTGQIDLTHHAGIRQMRPVEIHLRENGSITDEPSFCIVSIIPDINHPLYQKPIASQISLAMLNDGLADIGYEIIKK